MDRTESGNRARYASPRFLLGKLQERGPLTCLALAVHRLVVASLDALRVRHLEINTDAFGHLAVEPDCFLKEGILGMRPPYRPVVLIPREKRISNRHLLSYWRSQFTFIEDPLIIRLLSSFLRDPRLEYNVGSYLSSMQYLHPGDASPGALYDTLRYPAIQKAWGDRDATVRLSERDLDRGTRFLQELGVPSDGWFVAFHVREAGFYKKWDHTNVQAKYQDYRNAAIESYLPAMQAVVDRGGWCVRLGDPSMQPLPPMEGVIDYAHCRDRADWLDVFLCAACKVMVGTGSGPSVVASVFGVPTAFTNLCPMGLMPYGLRDRALPKLIRSEKEGRLLTFGEILGGELGNAVNTAQVRAAGCDIVDNTADELRDVTLEMLDIAEGRRGDTEEDDALHRAYHALLRPGHGGYGSASKVGTYFLRKHRHLLD
jgi:putative glycosyltransferase (TIGR04372 family)